MDFIKRIRKSFSKKFKSQKGFSLLEMLIAMVIFLIVTGSIYGLLTMGRVSRNRSSRRTDVLKNARTAIHLIGRDALNAGLGYHQAGAIVPDDFLSSTLGIPQDVDDERDVLTSIIAGDNLFTNKLQDDPDARTDIIAFAYRDLNFFNGNAVTLKKNLDVSSEPETTRLRTESGQANSVNKYDLCLIESDSSQIAAMVSSRVNHKTVDIKPNDPLSINLPHNGSGVDGTLLKKCTATVTEHCTTYLASLKRFHWVSYKVKEDGTLVRITYGNNTGEAFDEQVQESPLAYNVKDLQFTYVLEDGTVTSTPTAGPDGVVGTTDDLPNNFNLIRQVTVSIKIQSTEVDEELGTPEEIKLNATFSTRNLEYDQG